MLSRNTPLPITPRNRMENRVAGLQDYAPPPLTYTLKRLMPDGTIVYVGEFPTPKVVYGLRKRNK